MCRLAFMGHGTITTLPNRLGWLQTWLHNQTKHWTLTWSRVGSVWALVANNCIPPSMGGSYLRHEYFLNSLALVALLSNAWNYLHATDPKLTKSGCIRAQAAIIFKNTKTWSGWTPVASFIICILGVAFKLMQYARCPPVASFIICIFGAFSYALCVYIGSCN